MVECVISGQVWQCVGSRIPCLALHPGSATWQPCALGKITLPLCASVFWSGKWTYRQPLPSNVAVGMAVSADLGHHHCKAPFPTKLGRCSLLGEQKVPLAGAREEALLSHAEGR